MKTEKNIDEQTGMSLDQDMAPKAKKKKPSPDELLAEVRGRGPAKTYEFEDYIEVIHEMQDKNFSYAKIAEFLSERLGYSIARGQVYRAYQTWLEVRAEVEKEQAEAEHLASLDDRTDFDPEDHLWREREEKLSQATGALIRFLLGTYPEGSLPGTHLDVLKRAVAFYDEKARDDFAAEQADKYREETRVTEKPTQERPTE